MGIERIDEELCSGCQICVDDCPADVIRFDEARQKAYIAYRDDCIVCLQCVTYCPMDAVSVSPLAAKELILPC